MHGNPSKVAPAVAQSAKPARNHALAHAAPLPLCCAKSLPVIRLPVRRMVLKQMVS
jgi:hypothetical protein